MEVTELLVRVREGDGDAFDSLVNEIYGELRAIASGQRRSLGASHTVNTTAVVHEAYEKMANAVGSSSSGTYLDRGHFFRIAARVMRDIIVDYARAQSAQKRGGRQQPLSLDEISPSHIKSNSINIDEVLSVNTALKQLAGYDADAAQVAELRYFAGLTITQTAEALDISTATVKRRWTIARAWLLKQLA